MIPKIIKDCTAFIDGIGYEGRVTEMEIPKIAFATDDHRGGGMDGPVPIEMGMEGLTCAATFAEMAPELYGLLGRTEADNHPIVFRASQERGAFSEPVVATCRGGWKQVDPGTWKPGDKAATKFEGALTYFKLQVAGRTVVEVDLENAVRIIDGVDQLAGRRRALGL